LEVTKAHSFESAQICSGGVDVTEISPETMESKLHKGIYFAGEMIDIDGACGGYNLQWAWSSGMVAGTMAARKEGEL
ncbi:MAG TPA: NAD(P)/FAD-dependent oxidoreductase, partial [Candidatus Blautia avistercoris]|nr:NAD(P)/FAD-dependent oxidoreductase [Candidatus Blautia avistercoris]